jgi:hypothetical protein
VKQPEVARRIYAAEVAQSRANMARELIERWRHLLNCTLAGGHSGRTKVRPVSCGGEGVAHGWGRGVFALSSRLWGRPGMPTLRR